MKQGASCSHRFTFPQPLSGMGCKKEFNRCVYTYVGADSFMCNQIFSVLKKIWLQVVRLPEENNVWLPKAKNAHATCVCPRSFSISETVCFAWRWTLCSSTSLHDAPLVQRCTSFANLRFASKMQTKNGIADRLTPITSETCGGAFQGERSGRGVSQRTNVTVMQYTFAPKIFAPKVFAPKVFAPKVFAPKVFAPKVFAPKVHRALGVKVIEKRSETGGGYTSHQSKRRVRG